MTRPPKQAGARPAFLSYLFAALLILTALGVASVAAVFCVRYWHVRPVVRVELGEETPLATSFLRDGTAAVSYAEEPDTVYPLGMHRVTLCYGDRFRTVWFSVKDTVAPAASGLERTVSTKTTLTPDALLCDLADASVVKLTYVDKPAFGTVGDYTAVIRMEDASGNAATVTATVHVRMAVDSVTVEAGAQAPTSAAFLLDAYTVTSMTVITPAMLETPAVYPITIEAEGRTATSELVVVDTVAPVGKTKAVFVSPDTNVQASDFFTEIDDETLVTASFVEAPDPNSTALQTVTLALCDLGDNETRYTETLLFSHVAPLSIEARNTPLTAAECVADDGSQNLELEDAFTPDTVGLFTVRVRVNGVENLVLVEVRDTTPPAVEAADAKGFVGFSQTADDLVQRCVDMTETETVFLTEPDWNQAGEQDVTLCTTDAAGNETRSALKLTLEDDTTPPTLVGVKDRYCYVGEAVAYFAEVFATDNTGCEVALDVDTTRVNANRAGEYRVVYTATDAAGNVSSKACVFTFVNAKVTEEDANTLAQSVLDEILTDDMTLAEQIEAIYNYVFKHVRYVSTSNKADWRAEAVRGIQTGKGDCFTFYATARLLLEHTDAQLLSVQRKSSKTRHYWLLVNIGTGWYHYDCCNVGAAKERCFMWTNAQTTSTSNYFWRYETSLYPDVATTRYSKADAEAVQRGNGG